MKSHEQKYAEAIGALTHRLTAWGVADPETKAREFVRDLTVQGWRGVVGALDLPPANVRPADPETRDAAIKSARATNAASFAAPSIPGNFRSCCVNVGTEDCECTTTAARQALASPVASQGGDGA